MKPNVGLRPRLKKRVLLVENNESTIEVVEMELKHLGYEVSVAKNGVEAVKMAVTDLPDLIIMDIRLPKMDGFAATVHIRKNPATRDIPILAVTAKALPGDRELCLVAGFDGYYIATPFTHTKLEIAITRIIKRRQNNLRTKG